MKLKISIPKKDIQTILAGFLLAIQDGLDSEFCYLFSYQYEFLQEKIAKLMQKIIKAYVFGVGLIITLDEMIERFFYFLVMKKVFSFRFLPDYLIQIHKRCTGIIIIR